MEHLNRRIENYWDERSKSFSQSRRLELNGVDGLAWKNIFKKNLPAAKNLKILDVGTGAGFFAAILSKLGHKVIGVDMSTKMLGEAQKNLRELNLHADFHKMNAQKLDFDDETFDAIVTRNLTWTLPDVKAAYREWRRVLKVGGVLMNFDSDYGDKNFSTCTKTKITDELLSECDAIKNSLTISTRRRPMWDAGFLEGLNFSVRLDEDISHVVQRDNRCVYDSVPLFAICAVK
ncbi:MAG: class I SAM-dependent methyltransferase [Selenomonadaceae bacterium]|nr:class I SAM-dependent methyltransferase [Selenomonadaceae bacterium]MBQ7723248.1 class I SAM-dependent methyltransferase [Selenomonadaceae bacterium]